MVLTSIIQDTRYGSSSKTLSYTPPEEHYMVKWVIVVDDDISNLKVAGHILNQHGIRATCIKSGPSLLKYVGDGNIPDLILLDINMPEMDGFETLERLRDLEKKSSIDEIPVIFLTAAEGSETESRGFEVGVSDYIRKPFNPEVLLRRIGNIVDRQEELHTLKSEATTDQLTGFLNKSATGTELSALCASEEGTLAMIDLDSFKLVNDIHGHDMGDRILITFSEIIKKNAPEGSRHGRIGGDEFVSFLTGMKSKKDLVHFTQLLNDELVAEAKKLMGEDMDIPLGASVGAVMVPRHGNVYDALLKYADKALYTVKKNGKHGCLYYRAEEYSDDELNRNKLDINTISEILGERTIPDVALQLDKEAFSYVYRYVMRYNLRNCRTAGKLLFTLDKPENVDEQAYMEYCDEFGNHIRGSLRKSDIFMRTRFNQYFVFLTEVREDSLDMVGDQLIRHWNEKNSGKLIISVETHFEEYEMRRSGGNRNEE